MEQNEQSKMICLINRYFNIRSKVVLNYKVKTAILNDFFLLDVEIKLIIKESLDYFVLHLSRQEINDIVIKIICKREMFSFIISNSIINNRCDNYDIINILPMKKLRDIIYSKYFGSIKFYNKNGNICYYLTINH